MSSRYWYAVLSVITVVTLVRVAATHRVFSETLDEPVHIAAGFDWLSGLPYTHDPSHPPLARILAAAPLKMLGVPIPSDKDFVGRGNFLLYWGSKYVRHISRARWGNLILLAVALCSTALWARRIFSPPTGLIAAAVLGAIPPFLGHAGLATTDLAVAAALPLALLALDVWLERPAFRTSAMLGLAIGVGLLSKFSFVAFFPLTAAVVIVTRRPTTAHFRSAIAAIAVALMTLWAGYQFHFRRIAAVPGAEYAYALAPQVLKPAMVWIGDHVPVPAPLYLVGLGHVKVHNDGGHASYLLGKFSQDGFWYYFPVLIFVKTPVALLILMAWGAVVTILDGYRRKCLLPAQFILVSMGILIISISSKINIGIRHVLPIYAPLAVLSAVAVIAIWSSARDIFGRIIVITLLAWVTVDGVAAHPDYMAWFNQIAGDDPSRVAVDSNLDWGQDVLRLERIVRQRGIENLHVLYVGNAWLHLHKVNAVGGLQPHVRQTGWIATSETALKLVGRNGEYDWLTRYYRPVAYAGKSIRIYYVPP